MSFFTEPLSLSNREREDLNRLSHDLMLHPHVRLMRSYIQHGSITTLDHCQRVAELSFWMNRRLHVHADEQSLVRGALLHDYYLYDWHTPGGHEGLHGFNHPMKALANAELDFTLNDKERNIIRSHMWPLTLLHPPVCREAVLVSLADKYCSGMETLFFR